MGYGKWSSAEYSSFRSSYAGKSRDDIFTANKHRRIDPKLDPFRVGMRESRDSVEHPNSLAIAVFLDVTGSMGHIPHDLVANQLGALMDTLTDHGVQDPQLMFSAVGDHRCDKAPLQFGQFESSTQLVNDGLSRLFLEGGGGDAPESYLLAWHAAARHTSIDCWEKRQQKGFLFTVGDDTSHTTFEGQLQAQLFGYSGAQTLTDQQLLAEAQQRYHVFHVHVGKNNEQSNPRVTNYWQPLLGKRFITLADYRQLGLLVAMVVAILTGSPAETVISKQAPGLQRSVGDALLA
ncbi:hypothetical protein QWY85_00610 [Neolewinella lacunae]|uniref:Uncharacterized protein n=1 Tax=Neolewinella lacunae TaxID=1517758 RepID=A0A923TBY5_9BACT|nr:hypothetical protein [Neolewinella lacunae]MBC6993132.1 hypothetical protein [Neolewinella lacunae]MDN3633134.1 hypothetical protein [Neolewinella lacunae]